MKKTKLLAFILTCAIFLSALVLPIAAKDTKNITPTTKIYNTKSITVDGQKGAGEYSNTPHMVLDNPVHNNLTDPTYTDSENQDATATSYPNLYLSTDGENLYVFYEIAQNIIADNKNSWLYFSFESDEDTRTDGWQAAASEGFGGELRIRFGKGAEDEQGFLHYYYTYTDYKDSLTSVSEETKAAIEWALGESTMLVKSEETATFTVEFKIPLKDEVKKKLETGDTTIQFGAWQYYNICVTKTYKSNGEVSGTSKNWSLSSYPVYNKYYCTHSATLSILPRPIIAGFQSRPTPKATGSVDVRFVSVMKADAEKLANMEAGYDFTYYPNVGETGTEATVNCTKVYESLNADGGTLNATNYGGNYFFCYTISELSYGSSYTFDVACWTREDGKTTESIETVRVTITVSEAGEVSFTY